ncbi:MAG: T9SS type A sorting domain-containing protein [Bacteroidota bacterium]
MKNYKAKLFTAFLLCVGFTGVQAQESINAAGGNATGSNGSVSYSVGQVFYTSTSGSNGSVAQGVQQPYEISVVTEVEEAKNIALTCTAYPNPTTDFLTLSINATEAKITQPMSYKIIDINGRVLENKEINSDKTNVTMSNLVPANYFLVVVQGTKTMKTFKIVKN